MRKILMAGIAATALSAGLPQLATPANAALIYLAGEDVSGTGLGTVATVLTIQSSGSSSTESGGVAFNGSADVLSGNALTGASQTLTRSVGELGNPAPSALRLVFNASEPGGNSINLTQLVLTVYSAAGSPLFISSLASAITFPTTNTGTGNSGFVFGFDAADASNPLALAAFSNSANRIGLQATATDATGGNETFFVGVRSTPTVSVPEPASLALFGAGLLGLGMVRRRRNHA